MPEEKIWTKDFYQASDICSTVAARILVLAKAFKKTGNSEMCDELLDIWEHLLQAESLIVDSVGKKIDEEYKYKKYFKSIFAGTKFSK